MNMEFFLSLYDEPQNSVSHKNTKKSSIAHMQDDNQEQTISYLNNANNNISIGSADKTSFFTTRLSARDNAHNINSVQTTANPATANLDHSPSEIARMIEETCERLETLSSLHHFEALSLFLAMTREEARLIQKHHSS